ncbi:ATP-dependent helicase [Pelagibaculum spongiae]|uniref:DNA 3'-5' helicase n=1 Tax=Pelagibaculum spongiae TaxID=2080658 RepID=A0A2V1H3T3_9GAMM|nr:ATP-dependent helicase [Pelagibaculum spongiae]PVZ71847.1 hypothetical protein DC094_02135 [Pelagibaculum spongiae]
MVALTFEQQAVVTHASNAPSDGSSHALVAAVAGSGKSTTLVERIIYLLSQGTDPQRILVLMFNKSAQVDFQNKLSQRCRQMQLPNVQVLTFHALGLRICRWMSKQGIMPSMRLLESDGKLQQLLKQAIKASAPVPRDKDQQEMQQELLDWMDLCKSENLPPHKAHACKVDGKTVDAFFLRVFANYEKLRHQQDIQSFSDLIYDPLRLCATDAALAKRLGNRYDHILVDEYQDINLSQQSLLELLAGERAKVMVVGDEDQCIYAWRGSRPEFMGQWFEQRFSNEAHKVQRYTLSYTFRFGHQLSLLANSLIRHNRQRQRKLCISHASCGETKIIQRGFKSEAAESHLPQLLSQWNLSGRKLSEVAILVRTFSMSLVSELQLRQAGIAYKIEGAAPCSERAELQLWLVLLSLGLDKGWADQNKTFLIKGFQALLRFSGLYLTASWQESIAREMASAPEKALKTFDDLTDNSQIKPFVRSRMRDCLRAWRWLRKHLQPDMNAADALVGIEQQCDLLSQFRSQSLRQELATDRQRLYESLIDFARASDYSLQALLAEFSKPQTQPQGDCLLITSVHQSKGREWPLVILPELFDGRFPWYAGSAGSVLQADLEEERRLFYVAATRAKEQLLLLHPYDPRLARFTQNNRAAKNSTPVASRFLYESQLSEVRQWSAQIEQGEMTDEEKLPEWVKNYFDIVYPAQLVDVK